MLKFTTEDRPFLIRNLLKKVFQSLNVLFMITNVVIIEKQVDCKTLTLCSHDMKSLLGVVRSLFLSRSFSMLDHMLMTFISGYSPGFRVAIETLVAPNRRNRQTKVH